MDNSSSRGSMPERQPWETQQRHIVHEFKGRLKKRLRRKWGMSFEDVMAVVIDEIAHSYARAISTWLLEEMEQSA